MKFPNKTHLKLNEFVKDYTYEMQKAYDSIDLEELDKIASLLINSIKDKKKIYTCGNGGSSAISEHFVCDFLKGSSTGTDISPIIHSLSSNTPTLTAVANDIDYESVFSFSLERYGEKGDILICVSSSGNSPNIVKAIKAAKTLGMITVSFVGFSGGKARDESDYSIHIPNENYGVVEDTHHSLMHILAQYVRIKSLTNEEDLGNVVF